MMQVGPDEAATNFCHWWATCPAFFHYLPSWTPKLLWALAVFAVVYVFFWPSAKKWFNESPSHAINASGANSSVSTNQGGETAFQGFTHSPVTISKGMSDIQFGLIVFAFMGLFVLIIYLMKPKDLKSILDTCPPGVTRLTIEQGANTEMSNNGGCGMRIIGPVCYIDRGGHLVLNNNKQGGLCIQPNL